MSRHYFQPIISTILVLFFLAPTTTTLAHAKDSKVYDAYGEPIKPGQSYYLVPTAYSDVVGGVKPLAIGGSPVCPYVFYVLQADDNENFGDAIVFSTRARQVLLSSKVQILFAKFPPSYVLCRKYFSRVWGFSEKNSNYVVEVNGSEGHGPYFTIEDDEQGNYQIHICVTRNKCGGLNFINSGFIDEPVLGVNFTAPTSFVFEPSQFFSPRSVKPSRQSQATI